MNKDKHLWPARSRAGYFYVKNKIIYSLLIGITFFTLICSAFVCVTNRVYAEELEDSSPGNNIKICIDPGHGGENLGGQYEDFVEKDLTIIVANAMRDELLKYDGIEVYMTRESDVDMSLEERVKYASSVGADFFFCLHFNMSVNHDIYGTENWVSAFGKNYARGMDFAKIEMNLLTDLGLYDRGIKTRIGKKGTNYYGVLRIGDEEGIPGVIIEHCHLDNYNDDPYYDHHDKLVEFGKLDATAVAMYYGLKSDILGNDFTDFTYEPTPIPSDVVRPDTTEPEACSFEVTDFIKEINDDGEEQLFAVVNISANDPDCRMLYYSVSYDGGINYSERYRYIDSNGENVNDITVTIPWPYDTQVDLRINAYNMFDLLKESEVASFDAIESPVIIEETIIEDAEVYEEVDRGEFEDTENESDKLSVVLAIVICLLLLIIIGSIVFIIYFSNKKKKRKRRRQMRSYNKASIDK